MAGSSEEKVDVKELSEKQQLVRSQVLRQHAGFVPESVFLQRRHFFAAKVRHDRAHGPALCVMRAGCMFPGSTSRASHAKEQDAACCKSVESKRHCRLEVHS